MVQQAIENFEASDKQQVMTRRIQQAIKAGGMVKVLNVGHEKGKSFYYPKHQMSTPPMPEPGGTFSVPAEVAHWLMTMPYGKKLRLETSVIPSNYTAPPGYKLVPNEVVEQEVTAEELLAQGEE